MQTNKQTNKQKLIMENKQFNVKGKSPLFGPKLGQ